MKELKRKKRINKCKIKKQESIPIIPKSAVLVTHNLSTNISVTDFQYVQYSNEVGCQKNKINSNIHLCKPTSCFNGLNKNFAANTESIFLSQSVQVVPNNHSKGDFIQRSWKENYRNAEINFETEYVKLQSNDVTYRNRQQITNDLMNKTPLLYPDINFHVMSMVLPHLNESLHRNIQSNNVQNKKVAQSTNEANTEKNSKPQSYTYTNGFIRPVESTEDYLNQNKKENSKKTYYNKEQKDGKIEKLASKTSKRNISCETDSSRNFVDMMEIMNKMKIFLDSKKKEYNKSCLKQSELFLNEIIEVKFDDSQLKSLSLEDNRHLSMKTGCDIKRLPIKISISQLKISNDIQEKEVKSEENYILKNTVCINQTINENGTNNNDKTKFEVFSVKKRYPRSTDRLCKIEEATEHEKTMTRSVEVQYEEKYSSNAKQLKKQNYHNQRSKKQLKVLLRAKHLVSSTEFSNDFKLSLPSEFFGHILNTSTQELSWKSNITKCIDYQKTNPVNLKTNNVDRKIFAFGDNQNISNANCISSIHKEHNSLFQNKITPCKDLKDEMVTSFSENTGTPSSTYHVPQMENIPSEYSNFNLRGPYCRNYYVYYSQCIPYIPVGLSEISIAHMNNRTCLLKCIQLFSEQYKCLENITQSILLLINLMEKVSGNENTFNKCFASVCAIQKLLNDVVSINKFIKREILLQNHIKIKRNIFPQLQNYYIPKKTKFKDQYE